MYYAILHTLRAVRERDFSIYHSVALAISFVAGKTLVFPPVWLRFPSPLAPFACSFHIFCSNKNQWQLVARTFNQKVHWKRIIGYELHEIYLQMQIGESVLQ